MKSTSIDKLTLGQTASFTKIVSDEVVHMFAEASGDVNPAHLDDEFAKTTRFGKRIAHGMISASLISAVIGVWFPGPGSIYLGQSLSFIAPVYIGDTITATVEVIEIIAEKNRVKLKTVCTNQDGKIVTTGEALVMPPKA
ncbi:MAG: MaoC family dehydratase [Lachnospiraceae bacterium]|nr:MaoC family dehydratase [Lachnospiraceae bacterium]